MSAEPCCNWKYDLVTAPDVPAYDPQSWKLEGVVLPLGAEAADVPGLQSISFLGAASELLGTDLLVVNSEGVTEEQKDIDCASRCDDAAGDSSEACSPQILVLTCSQPRDSNTETGLSSQATHCVLCSLRVLGARHQIQRVQAEEEIQRISRLRDAQGKLPGCRHHCNESSLARKACVAERRVFNGCASDWLYRWRA